MKTASFNRKKVINLKYFTDCYSFNNTCTFYFIYIKLKHYTLQTVNFKNASQPYYVQLSPDLEVLNTPQQYTDKLTYYNWLKEGVKRYKE